MSLLPRLAPLLAAALLLSACAHSVKQQAVAVSTPAQAPAATAAPTPPPPTPTPTPILTPTPAPTPPPPTPSPIPSPTASPSPLPTPRAGKLVEQVATPIPKPTLAPANELPPRAISPAPAAPAPARPRVHVVPQDGRYAGRIASPEDPPKIFSVEVSDDAPSSGETVTGRVVTTTNVAAVRASLQGITIGFQRQDAGVFTVSYTVPHVPFFLKRGYTLEIVAETTGGRTASTEFPIRVR